MQKYIEFKTEKGTLRGFMHVPEISHYPMCIMFHGFTGNCKGDKFSYVRLARMLEKSNVGSLRCDFLGTGESDLDFYEMTFEEELESARYLVEEMLKRDEITELYILGHSMGGAIASEIAKLYPQSISKMVLWAPALNLPELFSFPVKQDIIDVWGFEIGRRFIEDIQNRDLFKNLGIYQHPLLIIHGNNDQVVDFKISKKYLQGYHDPIFKVIEKGSHSFDKIEDMAEVLALSYDFLSCK